MESSEFKPHHWPSLGELGSPRPPGDPKAFQAWGAPSPSPGAFSPLGAQPPAEPPPSAPVLEDPAVVAAEQAAARAAQAAEIARAQGFEAGAAQAQAQSQALQSQLDQALLKIQALDQLLAAQRRNCAQVAQHGLELLLQALAQGQLRMDEQAWRMAYRSLLDAAQGRAPNALFVHPHSLQAAHAALAKEPALAPARVEADPRLSPGELMLECDGQAWAASIADAALRLRDVVAFESDQASRPS